MRLLGKYINGNSPTPGFQVSAPNAAPRANKKGRSGVSGPARNQEPGYLWYWPVALNLSPTTTNQGRGAEGQEG